MEIIDYFCHNCNFNLSSSNRDAVIYGTSCFTSGVATVMEVLSEGVLQPRLTDQEVDIILLKDCIVLIVACCGHFTSNYLCLLFKDRRAKDGCAI